MTSNRFGETLSAEEQAYFDKRGDVPEPQDDEGNEELPQSDSEHQNEPEAEQKSEPVQQEQSAQPKEGKKNVKVPIARLDEEVEKRRNVERQLEDERKSREEAQRNLDALRIAYQNPQQQQVYQSQPVKQQVASPEQDPIENLKHLNEELAQMRTWQVQELQRQQQMNALGNLHRATQAKEDDFKRENPDYDEAANFLRNSITEELRILGHNETEINQRIASDIIRISADSFQSNQNPAEKFYKLAKSRGYQAKSEHQSVNGIQIAKNYPGLLKASGQMFL